MGKGQARRKPKVVPECQSVIDQWKYEIAAELGLPVYSEGAMAGGNNAEFANAEFAAELGSLSGREAYWGHITSRDAGAVGGRITRRLVQQAQQILGSMN